MRIELEWHYNEPMLPHLKSLLDNAQEGDYGLDMLELMMFIIASLVSERDEFVMMKKRIEELAALAQSMKEAESGALQ